MDALKNAKRLVVKVGSSLLTDGDAVRQDWLESIVRDIAKIKENTQVVLVSSGAIPLGKKHLKTKTGKALSLHEKQAAAALGQSQIFMAWHQAFKRHLITAAQILLTLEDTERRRNHLNMRHTLNTLLSHGVVPIINENDTVATEEIRFGDNDRLAARVATAIGADMLLLLTDIDGLYNDNPRQNKNAKHLPTIDHITPEIEAMAGHATFGTGGMVTKIIAAKIATQGGCQTIIADGRSGHLNFQRTTIFSTHNEPRTARKQWILSGLHVTGTLIIDDGAAKALRSGKSLLPAGVVEVEGSFNRGDLVEVKNQKNTIARGLVAWDMDEAQRIIGHQSQKIAEILGYGRDDEMIHRDDLVLL